MQIQNGKPFSSIILLIVIACLSCTSSKTHFSNPLLSSGADPWSIYKDGFYYYTHTVGDRLVIWKTKNIAALKSARKKTIFVPPPGTAYSKQLWAPEIHFIDSSWYIYFAADDGRNENHRLYVLQNRSANPMKGQWEFRGKIADSSDKWAIDGSVFSHQGQLYFIWSGWEGDTNGRQDLYISKLKNPWTMDGPRVRISSPVYEWERYGNLNDKNNPPHVAVNEGPQFISKDNKLFIVYSASGCWTDKYSLGMLMTSHDSNLMDSSSWKKNPKPVFETHVNNSVFAPGHNSFFKSPDGTEDWILYHANAKAGMGCGSARSPRAQKFTWNPDGTPNFGIPSKAGEVLAIPAKTSRRMRKINK